MEKQKKEEDRVVHSLPFLLEKNLPRKKKIQNPFLIDE
jgi:hypothetical protein